jgi:hypothetical protein
MEYTVVYLYFIPKPDCPFTNCLETFESMVQKKLIDGWNVAGGVSITYQEQKNCYLYSQAMTRPKPVA